MLRKNHTGNFLVGVDIHFKEEKEERRAWTGAESNYASMTSSGNAANQYIREDDPLKLIWYRSAGRKS